LDEVGDESASERGVEDSGDDSLAPNLHTSTSDISAPDCPFSDTDVVSVGVAISTEEDDDFVCESWSNGGLEASAAGSTLHTGPVSSVDDSISHDGAIE